MMEFYFSPKIVTQHFIIIIQGFPTTKKTKRQVLSLDIESERDKLTANFISHTKDIYILSMTIYCKIKAVTVS